MASPLAPFIAEQLLASSQVTMKKEFSWFKRDFSVSSHHTGVMLLVKRKGLLKYRVTDTKGNLVAMFRIHTAFMTIPWVEVTLAQAPMVKVRLKGGTSRSTLILDEDDQPVLKIKLRIGSFCESFGHINYDILGEEDIKYGNLKKDVFKCDLVYPADLDIRYKIGLFAAIIYTDYIEEEWMSK